MEIEARVTRSLRRRLNSVDLEVKSNGRSTTPISEFNILKEGPTTTPSRRGRKLLSYTENDGETLENTPVNRTTRRRSVTESPAFSGTPLRKTRRNSTSGLELTNENIASAKKNLKKSFITEVVLEEISTDDDLKKSQEKKKMNLMIKIPKLKLIEISPTRITDSNKFQNQEEKNSENENIVKNKYNEPQNELNHDCGENNDAQISNENTSPFSMSLRKNKSPQNVSVNKTKNLESEITQSVLCFNKKIEKNIEESSPTLQNCKFNNSPIKTLVLPFNSKTTDSSKNNILSSNESKINNESIVILTDDKNELVSESQFSEKNKTNFKIKAVVLKKDESEYCKTSLNEIESSLRNDELSKTSNKKHSLKNFSVTEKSTKNISNYFNFPTEENKSNEYDTPEETANKSLNISKTEETLSNSNQELIRENVTETNLKSVTFNDEELYSEKKFCQFPKTPIGIKSKSCVRIENSDSPTKLNSYKVETNGSEKINNFEIDKLFLNNTPNKGAETNINASSTPLIEYVNDVNLRNKKNHLLINKQENNSDVFSKSWTQSVRRSTSIKIDTLSLSMFEEKKINTLLTSKINENKMKINSEDLESNNYQESSSDKSENGNEFIDNEAEEVEEEDSMDEEERQYIEENEFVEKGISLGSEDTDHSNNNESCEYNSFIVSDNEENDIFSLEEISRNSSDDKCNTTIKLKKKYKRIKEMNSDSDHENLENNKRVETIINLTENIEVKCNPDDLEVQQTNSINSPEKYLNSSKSQNCLTNEFNVSNITQSSKTRKNSLKLEQNSIVMCTDNDNETIKNNNPEIDLDGKSKERLNKSNENFSLCKANLSSKDEKLEIISNSQSPSKNKSFCQFKQKNKKDNALTLEVSKFIDQSSSEEEQENSPSTSKKNQSKKDPQVSQEILKMISEENVESSIKIVYENSNSQDHNIRKNNTKIKENDVSQSFNHSKNYRNISETKFIVPDSYNEKDKDYIAEGVIDEESSNLTEYDSDISTKNIPTSLSFTSCLNTNILKKNPKTSLSFTEGFTIKNTKCISSESGATNSSEEIEDPTTNSSEEIENECTNSSNIEKKELENPSSTIGRGVCDLKEFEDETVFNLHKTANFHKSFSISQTNESKNVTNYSHILKRCNEILNAANEAKLKEKLKKKSENFKNGKKTSVAGNFKNTGKIEKLKHKKAVSKAVVCAQTILTKTTKNSSDERKFKINDKILPLEIIEIMCQEQKKVNSDSKNKKKLDQKYKMKGEYHNNLENKINMSTNLISTSSGIFLEEPVTPKKVEKIELATGTVFEEPITPIKLHKKNCFMESPVTPIGFKVRKIISAGQENIPEFNIRKNKRKLIDDPVHVLPQRVWSSSGEFVEEVYKPLNNKNKNVRTEFYAVPLKTKKLKSNQNDCGVINKNALDFKNNALPSTGSYRETSKQLLQRKERQKFY